jgi:hypothetical protein
MDWRDDPDVETVTIAKVEPGENGWAITRSDGWAFFVGAEHGVEPRVGQTARFYGKGIGFPVRGLALDDQCVFYRTPDEDEARHRQQMADDRARKRADFEKNRPQLDAAYEAMPPEFQRRLDGFRKRIPTWRWNHEPYESFVCTEAVKIAHALGSAEAVREFARADTRAQARLIPHLSDATPKGLDYDAHSGNTFGTACHLAVIYMTEPEAIERSHAAICPVTGCVEAGCWSSSGSAWGASQVRA